MGRERVSVQARENAWRGREGTRKSVSASLLTAPGLRDSSSLRFPRCRFNSIPSVQSSFFFLCLIYVLLPTALTPALHSPLSTRQDKSNSFIYQSVAGNYEEGIFFVKDAGETAVSCGTRSLVGVAVVDFPVSLCQCFVRGSRQTVGVAPLTGAGFKGLMKMRKLVLSYARSALFASDLCNPRRWNKFAVDLRAAK